MQAGFGEWPPDAGGMGVGRASAVWGTPAWALVCGWVAPEAWLGTWHSQPHPPDTYSLGQLGGGSIQRPHSGAGARFPGRVGWVSSGCK